MHPTITCKMKSGEKKRFFKTVLSPKLWCCHFVPKIYAKAVLMNRQKNLMISISLFSLRTWKKIQINIYAFFNHFSIIASAWSEFGRSCSVALGRWTRLLGNIFWLHLFLLVQNKRYFILSPLSRAAQCICSGLWSFGGKIGPYYSMVDSEKGALPTVQSTQQNLINLFLDRLQTVRLRRWMKE